MAIEKISVSACENGGGSQRKLKRQPEMAEKCESENQLALAKKRSVAKKPKLKPAAAAKEANSENRNGMANGGEENNEISAS